MDTFVTEALSTCVKGDYEAFRLLWSVRQEPLHREEFEQGWQAVKTVRVRAIEKIVLPERQEEPTSDNVQADPSEPAPDVSFVLLTEASFDPNHPVARRGANREFALLILREQDAWRLGRAPHYVRDWIKSRSARAADQNASNDDAPRDRTAQTRTPTGG